MGLAAESRLVGDGGKIQIGGAQQASGRFDPAQGDVLVHGVARGQPEVSNQRGAAGSRGARELVERKLFAEMRFDVRGHLANDALVARHHGRARLRATGNLKQAKDVMEAVQLAIQAGLPGEAKSILDEGFQKQILGTGDAGQTERQNRLKALVEKKYADDQKIIASTDAEAEKAPSGDPLVKTGLAYVTYGNAQKGLPMMEKGLQKGGLKNPEHARLHQGYAYVLAGDKAKARAAFKTVKGTDGAADFARLWGLLIAP